jgi:hypothetical protein
MRKFKVGDKVEIVDDFGTLFDTGDIGRVVADDLSSLPYKVQVEYKGEQWFEEYQLKLMEEDKGMSKKLEQSLVEGLPICADGKRAVTRLLEGMGYEVEQVREPKIGEVWRYDGHSNVLIVGDQIDSNMLRAVLLDGGSAANMLFTLIDTHVKDIRNLTFVASSLQEFLSGEA